MHGQTSNSTLLALAAKISRLKHYQATVRDLGTDGRTIQRHCFIRQIASLFSQDAFFRKVGSAAIPAMSICCQSGSTHFSSMH